MKGRVIPAALVAFVLLAASAVGASRYLINSTRQIRPSVLHSLRGRQGPQGETGPAGSAGPPGPSTLAGITVVNGPVEMVAPETAGGGQAFCPAGSHAIGGGGYGDVSGIAVSEMGTANQSWFILVANTRSLPMEVHAEALCVPAGDAVAARTTPSSARFEEALNKLRKRQRITGGGQ